MKKILHVISSLAQGGTESVVINYFNNIDGEKVKFDFLVIWGNSPTFYDDRLLSQGCRIYRMKHTPKEFFEHGKELREFFESHKEYDAVHIHAMSSLRFRVAKAAKKSGVKNVVYHSHTSSTEKHAFLHKLFKNKINKFCDYKFACSRAAGKYMYNGDFTLVKNAIDLDRFCYNENFGRDLREKFGLTDKFVVGNVGRLTSSKNQKFLFCVLKELKYIKPNAVLFLIGDGGELYNLRNEAERTGLAENVIFAGNAGADVYKYYSLFDCFAFPSLFEGLSMVLIEAQANGLPIISSDTLSPEHKISENFTFLPVCETTENYKAWANALSKSATRTNNRELLVSAGYDIKTEAEKLQNFYLGL